MSSRTLPEYFIKDLASKFSLSDYTTSVDFKKRFPSIPVIISPNFLEAGRFLLKCSEELNQDCEQIFMLTKLTNLARPSFKKFLAETNHCKCVYLIPKLIFDGYESPAPFGLCLLQLETNTEAPCQLRIW